MKILFFGPYPLPVTGQSISFKETYDNVNFDKVLINTSKFGDRQVLNSLYSVLRLISVFITNRLSCVYFTCSRSKSGFLKDFCLLIMCRLFNVRVVNHLHGTDFKNFYKYSGFLKYFIKFAYSKVHTSIVLVDGMENEFSEFPKMKPIVINNCYPRELEDVIVSGKEREVLFLSNLIRSKGILEFLDAADLLCQKYSDIRFNIAGKPMGDNLASEAEISKMCFDRIDILKSKYGKRINYLGLVRGKEKIELLKKTSIFILPSYYKTEAFPISIIEAMRTGCAIVTTNYKYLPSIVRECNGILVEPKSIESIVVAVDNLFQDEGKLIAMQQYNMVEAIQKYSPDRYIKDVKSVLEVL